MNGLEDHLISKEGTKAQIDADIETLTNYLHQRRWRFVDTSLSRGGIFCPEHGEIDVNVVQTKIYFSGGTVVVLRRKGWCCDKYPLPYSLEAEIFTSDNLGESYLTNIFNHAFNENYSGGDGNPQNDIYINRSTQKLNLP